jgi:hypothetical protein
MIMSARYNMVSRGLVEAATSWVGRPAHDKEQTFALFHAVSGDLKDTRWYVYGIAHDAIAVEYSKLPEAVRMAYLLIQ